MTAKLIFKAFAHYDWQQFSLKSFLKNCCIFSCSVSGIGELDGCTIDACEKYALVI